MLAGIIAGKVGTRFGVPALLLFLITGMLFGSAGLGIQYNDTNKTQFVGMIALTVILFFGGFETKVTRMLVHEPSVPPVMNWIRAMVSM